MAIHEFAISRPTGRRKITRAFNGETARQALSDAGFGPCREAFGFTKGQFSIIDLIDAALSYTGPAHATIATWTAADDALRRCAETMRAGTFLSVRLIIDRSFETRQPTLCATMRELFGDEAIRTTNSHAKFVLLKSEGWRIAIQTSMNLNFNKRIENFWIADDPDLFDAYSTLVDEIFALQPPGESFGGNSRKVRGQTEKIGHVERPDLFPGVASAATIAGRLPTI